MPHGQSEPAPDARDLVAGATQRLLQSVDAIDEEAWTRPTALPGWTRAHVLAHLTLNAEGLARALDGVRKGSGVPIYDSPEARDADIEELAGQPPADVRERLFAATAVLRDEIEAMTPDLEAVVVERTPGGPTSAALDLVPMRWREVEIHHVDLEVGYLPSDWDPAFADHLLAVAARDRAGEVDLLLRSTRGDVVIGTGPATDTGPVVSGAVADLAWWLVRGVGEGLSGPLPTLGPWQRRPPTPPPSPPAAPTPVE